ncbi:transmembrane sensor [Bordetella ansorpii]|uniref:Transmembrane sensor n=1 Tax=Bordetella ansorpii TaxID=288768 RepID=A0A157MWD5_9BORD|nr:FecR domain-containing protein [Bordetella ansorpii]SAI13387.1 transmembrane sensor [Bordetella ansorpii]
MTAALAPRALAPADRLAEQAAHWIVLLTDDDAAERERARREFEDWKRSDPRHAAAAADMEALVGRMMDLRGAASGNARPARAALDAALTHTGQRRRRTRRLGTALAVALALGTLGWTVLGSAPFACLTADIRTSGGQWQTHTLPDGSRITLNGNSAINLHYGGQQREIELLRGDVLVEVAKDAQRPFYVDTTHGRIRALGTRFVVEREAGATRLSMIESSTAVQSAAQRDAAQRDAVRGNALEGSVRVDAGQQVRITATSVGPVRSVDAGGLEQAWNKHQLVVDDQPLDRVLDELSRHSRAFIRYDRQQIAHIRISAVLPRDDNARALALLQASFPALRVRTYTPYLVVVDVPAAQGR